MDRERDEITVKTLHQWTESYGYDPATYCRLCHASNYDTQTKYCEDYKAEVVVREQKKTHTHPPTEAAWNHARQVLTADEWSLIGLDSKRPYREKDRIIV